MDVVLNTPHKILLVTISIPIKVSFDKNQDTIKIMSFLG